MGDCSAFSVMADLLLLLFLRLLPIPAQQLLGGCSTFNMQVWNRAPKCDYDAWWMLGNEGWDWDSLLRYHRRVSTGINKMEHS